MKSICFFTYFTAQPKLDDTTEVTGCNAIVDGVAHYLHDLITEYIWEKGDAKGRAALDLGSPTGPLDPLNLHQYLEKFDQRIEKKFWFSTFSLDFKVGCTFYVFNILFSNISRIV